MPLTHSTPSAVVFEQLSSRNNRVALNPFWFLISFDEADISRMFLNQLSSSATRSMFLVDTLIQRNHSARIVGIKVLLQLVCEDSLLLTASLQWCRIRRRSMVRRRLLLSWDHSPHIIGLLLHICRTTMH